MKHFIITGLSFLYMIALAGLPVNVHFCKGAVVSMGILPSDETCCCHEDADLQECCTHEMPEKTSTLENTDECCSSEHYLIQYFEDKKVTTNTNINFRTGKDHILNPQIRFPESDEANSIVYQGFCDLPPHNPQPLWLLHCTFTFYG